MWNKVSIFSMVSVMLFLAGTIISCNPNKDNVSAVPKLIFAGIYKFNSGYGYDSFIEIDLGYEDSDGDLGLNDADTLFPFGYKQKEFYNLKVYYQHKIGVKWMNPMNPLLSPSDTLVLHERVRNITPTGRSKAVHGNLILNIPARPFQYRGDTVRFTIQFTDRALHKSNIIVTPSILLEHP
jgi:hypothetical protein